MPFPTKSSACLPRLPIEIILDIYQHLDLSSIFRLSLVNKHFLDLFKQRKAVILIPVLRRDFSPFDELLQIHTASADDIDVVNGQYRPRVIIFKRFLGDKGHILTPQSKSQITSLDYVDEGFTKVVLGRKPTCQPISLNIVTLTENDLDSILHKCRLVKKWEELFPQMRWYHEPENCRSLRPHEKVRFRRALYRWWLYGIYFHGDFPRPRVGLPEPYVHDVRTSQMRYHATSELLELMDLLETIKDVILYYICPRLDPTQHDAMHDPPLVEEFDRGRSLTASWNDQSCWGRIVKTYAKLGPKELMYYFENIYSYPRKRLISEIRLHRPNFTFDQESIQIAIRCALDERKWLDKLPSLAEDSVGGIIDFDDERDAERSSLGEDASPDGLLPPGTNMIQSYSHYSPRGDDGSYLEGTLYYQAELESLSVASVMTGVVRRW